MPGVIFPQGGLLRIKYNVVHVATCMYMWWPHVFLAGTHQVLLGWDM